MKRVFHFAFLLGLCHVDCIPRNGSSHRVTRAAPPRKTVAEYNNDINNNPAYTTVSLSTKANPNPTNPVLDYTYQTTASGLKLPLRIRGRILPQHLRESNTRKSNDVSSGARTSCNNMGMNRGQSNGNNDQCGHLIPYILGGPSDWFNIVPQTQRINIGTATNTDLIARSVWRESEKNYQTLVAGGKSIDVQVLVTYNLPGTRPTGFGVIDQVYNADGSLFFNGKGYWFSNDPNDDPDVWNL